MTSTRNIDIARKEYEDRLAFWGPEHMLTRLALVELQLLDPTSPFCEFCSCDDNSNLGCKCSCHVDPDSGERYDDESDETSKQACGEAGCVCHRVIAESRSESDACERGTDGCCIDHKAENFADSSTCETW